MMGHLVLGRNDAGASQTSHARGWMWRVWRNLFARTATQKR